MTGIRARVRSTNEEIVIDVSGLSPQSVEDVRAVVAACTQRLFADGELHRFRETCTLREVAEEARRRLARA